MRTGGGLSCVVSRFSPPPVARGRPQGFLGQRNGAGEFPWRNSDPAKLMLPHRIRPMLRTSVKTVKLMGGLKEGCRYHATVVLQ
jgi:hypothetical protein